MLAENHQIIREGLKYMLNNEPDMEVVAEANDGVSAARLALEMSPDLVLMDMGMPLLDGFEATKIITDTNKDIRVLAISVEADRGFVIKVLRSGASGIVNKNISFAELSFAIRKTVGGGFYLGSDASELIVKEYLQMAPHEILPLNESLTQREIKILKFLADGKSTKEIAHDSALSVKTIENQRLSIMKKLDLYSIAELTKYAIRCGLTSV